MPDGYAVLDAKFPTFTGAEPLGRKVDIVIDFLQILMRELRYTLGNLDAYKNFNTASLEKLAAALEEPYYNKAAAAAASASSAASSAQRAAVSSARAVEAVAEMERTVGALQSQLQADLSEVDRRIGDIETILEGLVGPGGP